IPHGEGCCRNRPPNTCGRRPGWLSFLASPSALSCSAPTFSVMRCATCWTPGSAADPFVRAETRPTLSNRLEGQVASDAEWADDDRSQTSARLRGDESWRTCRDGDRYQRAADLPLHALGRRQGGRRRLVLAAA